VKRTARALAALTALVLAGLMGVATRTHAQTLTTGTISGTVTDPAGKKLSGVQIAVDSGQMDVTNASGAFIITDILPGTHTVKASLVGFQSVTATNVVVTQDLTTSVNIQFQSVERTSTGTQTVIAPLIRKNVTPTLYTVTSKEEQMVRAQPNSLYQYPGALASQPGVVPDQDGYPTVRGSRQNEVGYMLDGIMVTSATDGQFATNIVTVGMDRMNVYTGGYRAELGSSIGGIINSVIKTGASMRGQAAVEAATGSWNHSALMYEQGNIEKNGFNWYVSGNFFRTNFEKNHQIDSLPASEDVVAKFIQPLSKKDRLALLFTQGFERYELPVNDPFTGTAWGKSDYSDGTLATHTREWNEATKSFVPTAPTQDYSNQMYHIGSATWNHQFSPSTSLSGQYYAWNQHVDFNLLSPTNLTDQHTGSVKGAGKLDFSTQLSNALQVRVGGELLKSKNTQRVVFDVTDLLQFQDEAGNNIPVVQVRDNPADTKDANAYISTTWKPSGRLTADLGVRYDSREYTRKITLADIEQGRATTYAADLAVFNRTGTSPKYSATTPRFGLTYSLSNKTLLKGSVGRFAQFAPGSYLERNYHRNQYDTPIEGYITEGQNYYARRSRKVFDLKPEKVDSVDVGIEHQIGKNFGLAVTPYWRSTKDMFDYGQAYNADGTPKAGGLEWNNDARGHTRGVETKLQMRETRGLSGWVTYTYQEAKSTTTASFPGSGSADFAPDAVEHRLDYDQKHTVYVVGTYSKGRFEINPMLELGSGYPWGGQPGDYFDQAAGEYNYGYTSGPNGEKMPILVDGRVQSLDVNPYNTGWHKNLNVTFRLYTDKAKSSYYFLQIQNLTRSNDTTAKYWQDPNGSALMNPVSGVTTYIDENGQTQTTTPAGYAAYGTYTKVPPIFVLMGVRQTF
jgi:outer membrane receptor protein involved in Fe transport